MATIYEVAAKAGVSLATVSRVINGKSRVSERTREKVELAMRELGYQPNAIAQSLASNTSNRVGVVVSVLDGPFFSKMLATIETMLRDNGKQVIITAGHGDAQKEQEAIEFLMSCRCDALIVSVDALSDDYLVQLSKTIPTAVINHVVEDIASQCFIVDNEQGGFVATQTVINAGHTDIAYISGPYYKEDAMHRLTGHKRALKEGGLVFDPLLVFEGDYHEQSGQDGFNYLRTLGKPFSALVCANDEMATGVLLAARKAGLSLPEDLSIIGFDDLLFARYTYPRLTSVINPVAELGTMAARWVLNAVYDHQYPIKNVFKAEINKRESLSETVSA